MALTLLSITRYSNPTGRYQFFDFRTEEPVPGSAAIYVTLRGRNRKGKKVPEGEEIPEGEAEGEEVIRRVKLEGVHAKAWDVLQGYVDLKDFNLRNDIANGFEVIAYGLFSVTVEGIEQLETEVEVEEDPIDYTDEFSVVEENFTFWDHYTNSPNLGARTKQWSAFGLVHRKDTRLITLDVEDNWYFVNASHPEQITPEQWEQLLSQPADINKDLNGTVYLIKEEVPEPKEGEDPIPQKEGYMGLFFANAVRSYGITASIADAYTASAVNSSETVSQMDARVELNTGGVKYVRDVALIDNNNDAFRPYRLNQPASFLNTSVNTALNSDPVPAPIFGRYYITWLKTLNLKHNDIDGLAFGFTNNGIGGA